MSPKKWLKASLFRLMDEVTRAVFEINEQRLEFDVSFISICPFLSGPIASDLPTGSLR